MVVMDRNQQEVINRRLDGYIEITQVTQDEAQRSPQLRQLGQFLLHGN